MARRQPRQHQDVRHARIPIQFACVLVTTVAAVCAAAPIPARAFKVLPSAMSSMSGIRRAIAAAAAEGFDAVIAPVSVEQGRDLELPDGEAELLRQARENDLRVHLAIAVTVASAADALPASREHVLYQHPDWLMVPRQLAPELLTLDAKSPGYLGRIMRWARANPDRVPGLYVSPLDPDAASYLVGAVVAAVTRYSADGVYLEAVDFPGSDFDYSRHAMGLFKAWMRARLSADERARLDDVEAIDPFAYADVFPDEWRQYRESALTRLLERLRVALTAADPSLVVTAEIRQDPEASLRDHFQNWRDWLDRRIVDRIGRPAQSSPVVAFSPDATAARQDPVAGVQAAGPAGPR